MSRTTNEMLQNKNSQTSTKSPYKQPSLIEAFLNVKVPKEPATNFFPSLRAKALRLSALYQGQCLSTDQMSFSFGQQAMKFKCCNGHTFFKMVDELTEISDMTRKQSYSTAASSSNSEDEESEQKMYGSWCPKCESFYY